MEHRRPRVELEPAPMSAALVVRSIVRAITYMTLIAAFLAFAFSPSIITGAF